MVAHMQAISASTKHPEDSPSRRGPADPLHYAWLLQADMPSCSAKAGMIPGTFDMTPSPEDTSNSWETRAFAEDANGALAAGIWPPRAYPCSFCRREFRSAQALGGHMNVHRRDRARLRHSSPPQSPFCAPTCTPQATSLFQSEKYGVNHSAQSPHEPLKRINPSPIPACMSSIPPTSTPCTSLNARIHNPSNFVTSFPLRLHQLASEAASSLMQLPQPCGSADLLSLWPTCMTNSAKFACHSNVHAPTSRTGSATVVSSPSSNSMVSSARPSPSTSGAAPAANCRRDAPAIGPEDESPKKKSHTGGSLCCSQKSRNSSEIEGPQCSVVNIDVEEYTTCSDETKGARTGGVDLELRLGQRLPQ